MRHKYSTEGVIIGKRPYNEAGYVVTLLTRDLGLITARAEGVRHSGARLAHALQTLSMTNVQLVRGRESWRVTGATLERDYSKELSYSARTLVARVSGLLQRILGHDSSDERIFNDLVQFLQVLPTLPENTYDAVETLIVLRLLSHLGFDAGEVPPKGYSEPALSFAGANRRTLIERVNRGILATGL